MPRKPPYPKRQSGFAFSSIKPKPAKPIKPATPKRPAKRPAADLRAQLRTARRTLASVELCCKAALKERDLARVLVARCAQREAQPEPGDVIRSARRWYRRQLDVIIDLLLLELITRRASGPVEPTWLPDRLDTVVAEYTKALGQGCSMALLASDGYPAPSDTIERASIALRLDLMSAADARRSDWYQEPSHSPSEEPIDRNGVNADQVATEASSV